VVPKQSHNEDAAYRHGRLMSAHDNTLKLVFWADRKIHVTR